MKLLLPLLILLTVPLTILAQDKDRESRRRKTLDLYFQVLQEAHRAPQGQGKRFQCKIETEGEKVFLTSCQYEDEEDMVEGDFGFSVFPDKWKLALSRAVHGEGTAHFTETAKEVCLRQVRPLDGFIRHPVQEDLNLCQRKSKGWRTKRTGQYVNLDR